MSANWEAHAAVVEQCGAGLRTELVEAEDQDGLVDLEAKDLGLDKGKRLSVDLDETLTGLRKVS